MFDDIEIDDCPQLELPADWEKN